MAVVSAGYGEEFVVCATFNDASFVEHTNQVGVLDCRQTVGDDQRGAVFHQAIESLLH